MKDAPVSFFQPVVEPDEEQDIIEEVVVTGSSPLRSNLDSPLPVMVFDAAQLKDAGITTLGEFELCLFNWAQFTTLQNPSDRCGPPPSYNYTVRSEAFHEGRGAMVYAMWSHSF